MFRPSSDVTLPAPTAPEPPARPAATPRALTASCVVRARDFRQPWFVQRTNELAHELELHRKLWEFCVIAQVGAEHLVPGMRALGFGVGREPLASWLASRGVDVVATDRPDETMEWDGTGQHAADVEHLRHPDVCSEVAFARHVRFRAVDMNAIPEDLRDGSFDFTYSAGSFEHLGGIDAGLDFFVNQMACLRPGGLAAHTTEFNMLSYHETLESPNLSLYRVQELQVLAERLAAQGDRLWPLDLASGIEPDDLHVDSEPWGLPHLKIALGRHTTTSVLLVGVRGGA